MKFSTSSKEPLSVVSQQESSRILRGWSLVTVMIGLALSLFLAALDQTIVATALPTVVKELHGFNDYSWVATAYLLAIASVIPVVGKLSDQFGRKWFLVTGIVLFLLGSVFSGTAQTMTQLIFFRGFQGIGAGCLTSLVSTLLGDIFPPSERGRWQGLFVGIAAIASIVGPLAGGLIIDRINWRWVFYINLPFGILALGAIIVWLPVSISVRSSRFRGRAAIRRIDVAGALCAAAATICLLLGLTWGGSRYPWTSAQVVGLFIAAALLTIAFFFIERKVAEPLLPLDLLRNQIFAAGSLLSLTYGLVSFGVIFYLPLFIQAVLGQTSMSSTAALTPLLLGLTGGSIVTGWLVAKYKRYQALTLIGAAILVVGAILLTTLGTATALFVVTMTAIVLGVGLGVVNNTFMLAVQNAIPRERLGVGTGAIAYLRTIGQTVGTALLGALLMNMSTSQPGRQVLADGLHADFLVVLGVSVAILLLALLLKDVPLRERTPAVGRPATSTETNQP